MIGQCCYEPSGRHQQQHFAWVWVSSQLHEKLTLSRSSSNQRTGNYDIISHQQGGSKVTFSEVLLDWLKKHRCHKTTRLQK